MVQALKHRDAEIHRLGSAVSQQERAPPEQLGKLQQTIKLLEGKLQLLEAAPAEHLPEPSTWSAQLESRASSAEALVADMKDESLKLRELLDAYEGDKRLHQSSLETAVQELELVRSSLQTETAEHQQLQAEFSAQTAALKQFSQQEASRSSELRGASRAVADGEAFRITSEEERASLRAQVRLNACVACARVLSVCHLVSAYCLW